MVLRNFLLIIGAIIFSQRLMAVEVCFLANEGFLLKGEKQSVIFDALVAEPKYGYPAMSPENQRKLINHLAPFDSVTLALTSHEHADHFQRDFMLEHAKKNPNVTYLMTPQAKAKVAELTQDKSILNRIKSDIPAMSGEPMTYSAQKS